jgi:hypothetical protein
MKKYLCILMSILLFVLSACGQPPTREEVDQFYKDSAFVYDFLRKAHDQGRKELTYEEQEEFSTYEAYYDSESDFHKNADTDLQLISSGIMLMKSYLGTNSTTVGGIEDNQEFQKYSNEVQELLLKKYEK